MGLFGWLASHSKPEIDYRDYLPNEVEDIALESTAAGSKRGFLVGFPVGALVMALIVGGVVMAGLFTPPAPTPVPSQGQKETAAQQALSIEMETLREENQALKKQVTEAKAAAACPPCQQQVSGKEQAQPQASAPASKPTKQLAMKTAAPSKTSNPVQGGTAAKPIPSDCRQEGDCQSTGPRRVAAAPPGAQPRVARADTSPRAAPTGLAIVEVRTSQGQSVGGVPIAFHFLDKANQEIGGSTVATDPFGRATSVIPAGAACAEFRLPPEYVKTGRVKTEVSKGTGLPVTPGLFRTCGEILKDPNGILGVFTVD